MMQNKMYIAVELNDDGSLNDLGLPAPTMKKALECVASTFSLKDTVIYEMTLHAEIRAKLFFQLMQDKEEQDEESEFYWF